MFVTDRERQEDEMSALESICDDNGFKWKKEEKIECKFSVNCQLTKDLRIISERQFSNKECLHVKNLPPIHLYVQLPHDYPSSSAPNYHLYVNWLPPWAASLICQRLDDIWKENKQNEILFLWLDFLKDEMLFHIQVDDILDVSYLWNLFQNPNDHFQLEILQWTDKRVINGGLYLNPLDTLIKYNNMKNLIDFETNFHECGICFGEYSGKTCERISSCFHIFCKNCLTNFLTVRINDRNVNKIECPATDCTIQIYYDQIKRICPANLFDMYEKYLLDYELMSNKNIVHCPRKQCQSLVMLHEGENLASCQVCEYNFCAYCFKVFHGVVPCDMDSKDRIKLIEEYQNGDLNTKKILEKQYGKTQIREIVEKKLTNDYIKENTKACPTCNVMIDKISGCNLMKCIRCQANFCWLCNSKIELNNPYDHFTIPGLCSGRLFEGLIEDLNELDNMLNDLNLDFIDNFDLPIDEDNN